MPIDKTSKLNLKPQRLRQTKLEVEIKSQGQISCSSFHRDLFETLKQADSEIYKLVSNEYDRQNKQLQLVAAENQCSKACMAALGTVLQNKTAEGAVGQRLHGGCEVVDEIEKISIERAKEAFGARYANVQPHSGTQANQIVLLAVLQKGDKILCLPDEQGGHFSHGSPASITGKIFDVENYYIDKNSFKLDYDAISKKAHACKPKMIICGASFYPRAIDFAAFRKIADSVGAYLLADISHISGLVMAGAHQSPIDLAHFTTTSTYKCGGPRGGLILMGKDSDKPVSVNGKATTFEKLIDTATFPGMQGTPYFNHIAAKAVFFKEAMGQSYKQRQFNIIENAAALAASLTKSGFNVITGGTDNHLILVDVTTFKDGLDGDTAQKALEDCGIIVDKIDLPYQKNGIIAGIRLGTPIVTKRGMGVEEMTEATKLMEKILSKVEITGQSRYQLDETFRKETKETIEKLCLNFPYAD
jgi:glycine hydroxymethyltransferase